MKRLVVLALVASLGSTSVVFAEGSLLASASRITEQVAREQGTAAPKARPETRPMRLVRAEKPTLAAQQGGTGAPAVATSGMGKGKKILIALAAGIGVAAAMYTIDHDVLDVTPSSLGTRQD